MQNTYPHQKLTPSPKKTLILTPKKRKSEEQNDVTFSIIAWDLAFSGNSDKLPNQGKCFFLL